VDSPDTAHPLLPARMQPLLAVILAACLAGSAAWYVAVGGLGGGLVHHDAAPVRPAAFTVDINAADEAELAQLPGLGPATARRIVDRRRDVGPFATIESLLDVPGIGPATLEGMRPHLRPVSTP
jgi:competence ComEA-like helix-hairpin-helix protein